MDTLFVNIEFTAEDLDMILQYQKESEAVTVQAAIMNAISLALDHADDPLPLVLCKDCKHRTKRVCDKIEFYECDHIGYQQTKCGVTDDWFCADGERKDDSD